MNRSPSLDDAAVDDDDFLLHAPVGLGGPDPADFLKELESLDDVAEHQRVLERLKLDVADPDLWKARKINQKI